MREREREVIFERYIHIYRPSERQTGRRSDGRTNRRMNKGTGGQIDRQTDNKLSLI